MNKSLRHFKKMPSNHGCVLVAASVAWLFPIEIQDQSWLGSLHCLLLINKTRVCQSISSLADVTKLVEAASPLGVIKEMKETKDSSSESNSHVKFEGLNSQRSEHSAKQTSKKSSDGVSGKEDGKEKT